LSQFCLCCAIFVRILFVVCYLGPNPVCGIGYAIFVRVLFVVSYLCPFAFVA
jgi:hypothetical protein